MRVKISVRATKGRLQLTWSLAKKRYYLSLGYPDTPQCRSLAGLRAAQIEQDILFERFDPSLDKYRGYSAGKSSPPEKPDISGGKNGDRVEPREQLPLLLDLYQEYIEVDRRPVCATSTYYHQFCSWANTLAGCPHGLDAPHEVRQWLLASVPPNRARRILQSLNAMGRWAEDARKLPANPFCNMRIQSKKVVAEIPEPWTREERDQIIEGFRRSAKFHHYGNFVEFLFLCGCRPSEALALNWADVASDCRKLTFRSALTSNQSGKKAIKAGLKRQKARQVPLNRRLAELFLEMKGSAKSDRIVFTTPRGGLINWSSWSAKVWAPQLKALGLPHKKPYSTRHTMITLALQCGVSVADVATLVGNSPEIIHRHYAGVSRDLRLPE